MLRPIQRSFQPSDFPDLLVGLGDPDDAAVWKLDEGRALVATTDFFTPVVDDPYDYGAIAAANALSDIYAMGGKPFLALNVAALPPSLPIEIMTAILQGGADKVKEAGLVLAGGHSIQDQEPKYGLVALGFVHPQQMITKRAARPGDLLLLSKPLGFGVVTTALKREQVDPAHLAEAVGWMKRLNRQAAELAVSSGVRAGTDVTGFSLLGHGMEIAAASQVALRIVFSQAPLVSGARDYASEWIFPGGSFDNRQYFESRVRFAPAIAETDRMLLFDAQTSGGLLLCLPPDKLPAFTDKARSLNQPFWQIGEVVEGEGIDVVE